MPDVDNKAPYLSSEHANLATLHDILSSTILTSIAHSSSSSASKHAKKKGLANRKPKERASSGISASQDSSPSSMTTRNLEDLADFTEYLADELFACLPPELQRASTDRDLEDDDDEDDNAKAANKATALYHSPLPSTTLAALLQPVPTELHTGIQTCLPAPSSPSKSTYILEQILEAYCETVIPPSPAPTDLISPAGKPQFKAPPKPDTGCELCARPWIPLTQHHLIPRSAAPKAVKRGWHTAEACQTSIAWLCRACHSFVHGLASNDELARELYSVELLEEREDVQRWIGWVGRVRWKAR